MGMTVQGHVEILDHVIGYGNLAGVLPLGMIEPRNRPLGAHRVCLDSKHLSFHPVFNLHV